jgi:predicted RNA-binding protein with RPS1 domain
MTKYETGEIVKGCVTGIEPYGAFVSLDEYYSGLIHISEISDGFVKNIKDFLNVGETIFVKIVDSNEDLNQVRLSIKSIDYKVNKNKGKKIKETPEGFNTLKEKLTIWINEKIDKKD